MVPDICRIYPLFRKDQNLIVTIRDEGVGIQEELIPNITDPFFTTKREKGGTGLGLSVSSGIVKNHGGTLRFDSTPGKGTTATLIFPVQNDGNHLTEVVR